MRKATAVFLSLLVTCAPGLCQPQVAPVQRVESSAISLPLTNEDVLNMFKMGLSQETVLARIRSGTCKFDTSPAALQEQEAANVPDEVILALVEASSRLAPQDSSTQAGSSTRPSSDETTRVEPTQVKVTIPDGTPVEVEVLENVSSEAVEEGDIIGFAVVQPVQVNGVTVIERGAPARGRVTKVKKARHWGRAGKLIWTVQDAHTVDGQKIPLRLSKEVEGGGSSGKVAAAVVVTAIFFFPAAPLWGLKKGKKAVIPAGTRVTAFTHGESTVEVAGREEEATEK